MVNFYDENKMHFSLGIRKFLVFFNERSFIDIAYVLGGK